MPFRRKILYYGLLLGLTLLVIEGMAHLAYYAAYGQGFGFGRPVAPANYYLPPPPPIDQASTAESAPRIIHHPFYGFADSSPGDALNAMPPRPRREDTVVIGLLGGSVARQVKPTLERALRRRFAANELPRRTVVRDLSYDGMKQPQQTIILANSLLLGGEFDLIVNLDGFNEVIGSAAWNYLEGDTFPFFPIHWPNLLNLTAEEILLSGELRALRREQARLAAVREKSPLRRSALFRMANRYRQERNAADIIRLNHELAAVEPDYALAKRGPRSWLKNADELLQETGRLWYRSSLTLSRLAEIAGADYYHFLQPNQYVPGSKPLSPEELAAAYVPIGFPKTIIEQGYPLLREFSRDLPRQGINYFDLTGIFANHPETLYGDPCCHLNDRGNELLAAAMLRRLEPALRRLESESPAAVSPLAAARRPAGPPPKDTPDFQVSVPDDGKWLRYFREVCAPEDTEPAFFLIIVPAAAADLPPDRREYGFDRQDFSFAEAGGRFKQWQCAAQIRLPDYPIKEMRTGQHIPGQDDPLWSVQLIAAPNLEQLRADYAALSAVEPVARNYFDLYELDNRLLYLRETCAAADTAAPFFLHIIPEQATDLPAERRDAGFAHAGFAFARHGGPFDGKCLAATSLPEYPIKEMRTGQHIPGQGDPLWSVQLIAAPDLDQLRADYAALSAAKPAVRDYFDLYWQDNRLLYFRETCAAADTAAGFFLHIVPENGADLPAERRAAGFVHGGFDFVRQGGHFNGKCLASVPLPDYPIKEMRTGQYVAGQGELWSVVIAAP